MARVAAGAGGVIGAVVVRVVLAMVGCCGWCTGCWWWSCSWFVDSPRPAVVVLVVSMFVEAVGDARGFLASRGVVVGLVSAGGAMGGGAIDGPAGCSGSDAGGVGAQAAVLWSLVDQGLCLSGCW